MFPTISQNTEEEARLAVLHSYDILGDGLDKELGSLVKLAVQITKTSKAYISFVGRDTIFIKVQVGLSNTFRTISRNSSICQQTMFFDDIFLVKNIKEETDDRLSSIALMENLSFYATVPIVSAGGKALGCLCVGHTEPHDLDQFQKDALKTLSAQITTQLELRRQTADLQKQKERAENLANIFYASPEIHCVLNRNIDILFINEAACERLGYDLKKSLNTSAWEYCYIEDRQRVLCEIELGLKQGKKQFNLDFRLVDNNKRLRWIAWSMVAKGEFWYCYGQDITDSKRMEAEFMQLSYVASKVNNGVVISDGQNKVKWINDAFRRITGFDLDDIKGKPLADLIGGPETDWAEIENARKLTSEKKAFTVDILAYTKDKQKIWLSVYSSVILDENGQIDSEVEIIIDITEKKLAQQELEVLSTVASKSNTGVTICNHSGEIIWLNHSLEKLVGYSLNELMNKRLGDVLSTPQTDFNTIYLAREKAKNRESTNIEVFANKKDGTPIWLSVSNTPIINNQGQIERYIELITDITQRKLVEQEMVAAREQALQLSEAKEMLLSVMSHEIRTPLNAIIGMTHLLLESSPKPEQIEDLNILKFSSENLLSIVNDVLDFTKIETGNLHLEKIPFDLKHLCNDMINSLQVNALKGNNKLTLIYNPSIPQLITGDKTRLYQILINLLGNAIKFTSNGEIILTVSLVMKNKDKVKLYFEVSDTGIGIAVDKQAYIFETFTQARTDISRKYGGTGLGLSITKKLLQLYQSDIRVESAEGEGAKFSFEIEFEIAEQTKIEVENKIEKAAEFNDKKILIVDDNEINILIAQRILSKWGLNIEHAIDGYKALEMVKNKKYDLIFMDINMPGINGFETASLIRKTKGKYFQTVKIVALTGSSLHNEERKLKESGIDSHILKPFNPEELKKLLTRFLS
ncbi:PAS domain S-box protein [Pedobacter sp.]|uniref:PAS domain S-box protein n=1 Tax=Pedobacter sp. TaxID=1411316 RepID=UPI00396CAF9D